jgi:hypothetical protein
VVCQDRGGLEEDEVDGEGVGDVADARVDGRRGGVVGGLGEGKQKKVVSNKKTVDDSINQCTESRLTTQKSQKINSKKTFLIFIPVCVSSACASSASAARW